jgi:hypothetical protein
LQRRGAAAGRSSASREATRRKFSYRADVCLKK